MNTDKALDLALEALEMDSFYGTKKQEALAALEQMIAAARADEREACAKVCEDDALSSQYGERSKYRALLATTIRARGNT